MHILRNVQWVGKFEKRDDIHEGKGINFCVQPKRDYHWVGKLFSVGGQVIGMGGQLPTQLLS